jgi:type I restriction enzyme M protein
MDHDGFSLDDKRQPVPENDIPDILECWRNRSKPAFAAARQERWDGLKAELAPLKAERLQLEAEINRLTFESIIAPEGDTQASAALEAARHQVNELQARIAPLQALLTQLSRQFWVDKATVAANKYDLSASRYRQLEQDETYHEQPRVTMERLLHLEQVMATEVRELEGLLP